MPETALLSASQNLCFCFKIQYHVRVLLHQVCTYQVLGTTLVNHNARPAQLSSAQLYIAQQRRQRRAVPCLAPRCGALSCCDVHYFEHTAVPGMKRSIRYQVPVCTRSQVPVCTCCVFVFFAFSSVDLSRSPCFSPHAICTRTADVLPIRT